MISIENDLLEKVSGLFVKTKIVSGVSVTETPPNIQDRKADLLKKWAGKKPEDLDSIPEILAYRDLQKKFGQDPKINLPAVENMLVRGVLQGKFPKINSAVDSANVTSIENLTPIGLFDYDEIKGNISFKLAVDGDEFIPIGKNKQEKVRVGLPILADSEKVFSAIGVRDSEATKITFASTNLLLLSWGMNGISEQKVSDVLETCATLIPSNK